MVIVPIYKKGDHKECENYRGMSLLSVVAKGYGRILEKRIRDKVKDRFNDVQSGFRPGHSVQDRIFTLR